MTERRGIFSKYNIGEKKYSMHKNIIAKPKYSFLSITINLTISVLTINFLKKEQKTKKNCNFAN